MKYLSNMDVKNSPVATSMALRRIYQLLSGQEDNIPREFIYPEISVRF